MSLWHPCSLLSEEGRVRRLGLEGGKLRLENMVPQLG